MRILLITWNYPPKVGGMELMIYELVQNLPPNFHIDVFAPHAQTEHNAPERAKVTRSGHRGLLHFFSFTIVHGAKALHNGDYDLIVGGSALVAPILCTLAKLSGTPSVLHIHGLDVIHPLAFYQLLVRLCLPTCDMILANSRASRIQALERGVEPGAVEILSPGVDFSEFETQPDVTELRRKYGLHGKRILLTAGRLAKRKGLLEFIRYSFSTVVKQVPEAILLIAGGNANDSLAHDIDMESRIRREVETRGLEDNVLLLGHVPRRTLVQLFHLCHLFVLPAINVVGDMEGFGIVLLEANAAGKPVLATRLGGIIDAVEHGKSGILVEASSWEELSQAASSLLADTAAAQTLGEYGRERARTKFNWPVIGRRYAELLEGTAGHRQKNA